MAKGKSNWQRYKLVKYELLRIGQPFKHSKKHTTWWVKQSAIMASSINKELQTPMRPSDMVWVESGVSVATVVG